MHHAATAAEYRQGDIMAMIEKTAEESLLVAALYRFFAVENPEALRQALRDRCAALDLCGTLIIAPEGINGTIAGSDADIRDFIAELRLIPGCEDIEVKYSRAQERPFQRMKVKLKPEIVTLGVPGVDPVMNAGFYVDAADWNALIADPDTIVIDTRNDYEVAIGTFAGAIDPKIGSFRDFPDWFAAARQEWAAQGRTAPRIAMFCTGGIRCEKSTALARSMGCEEVYHLKGGILKYLEDIEPDASLWKGSCFVFDERVSLNHGLSLTDDAMCRECGHPVPAGSPHSCA